MSADTPQFSISVSAADGLALLDGCPKRKDGGVQQSGFNAHVPPALDGPNDHTIWFEVVENPAYAREAALEIGWIDAEKMDTVVVIIRDDFREFYMPLNSDSGSYEGLLEMLKSKHLKQAAKWNDELSYEGDIKDIGIDDGVEEDESDAVDWEGVFEEDQDSNSSEDDSSEIEIEDDLDEIFD